LILGSTAYVLLISRSSFQTLKAMVRTSARIAMGDVGETINVKRNDEIGDLLNAMNQMVVYLRHMSQTADAIAHGDLTVNVQPRSPADHFGNALQKMVASLNEATTELLCREAEARKLAAIVEYSHDAIISVQPDGTVISWNAGAETLLGYAAEQIIGKAVDEVFPDQGAISQLYSLLRTQPENFELVDGDAGRQNPATIETNLVRRDGSRVEISMTVSPVAADEAGSVSFSMIARDVTHKRLVERRLREFYSMISHELRTPLTSIRGALALIAHGVVPAESDNGIKLIQLAQSSCIRLVRLINHILDMRKIEDGNLHLELQLVPAFELLRLSVEEMEALAYERGVRLKIGSASRSEVLVDSDRMVQVLTNLISNAVKYSNAGQEVTIAVETADGGRCLRFKVTDHGGGIAEDHQSKLFRQFQQIDSSDSRAKEGSGLGLFISKALVEQHGGKIGVESEVGVGSTFWFEIAANPSALSMPVDCGGTQQSSTSNV
jgi:PAS domain S-box-containing protein